MYESSSLIVQLDHLLKQPEHEHLEFKEARQSFNYETLLKYGVALCNERGGKIILGITDRKPRRVVGTRAFGNIQDVQKKLTEALHIRPDVTEIEHPDGRVLMFDFPPRPIGTPIQHGGTYWMRSGESLVGMTPDQLGRIFAEAVPDFTAQICAGATLEHLSVEAIERFQQLWLRKSGNETLRHMDPARLLEDAELLYPEGVTYAALILLGSRIALGRFLAQAEVVFEYRSHPGSVAYQARTEHREGFFLFDDALWTEINLRNEIYPYQVGLFKYDIATFNEKSVREAILNAVCHRDYRYAGNVFVRQFPQQLEVVSPGGLPQGITLQNIYERQSPRNRRIADTLLKCGLVERSGQGMDLIVRSLISESKGLPNFHGTDEHQVALTLEGEVKNPAFVRFLDALGQDRLRRFLTEDFVIMDKVARSAPLLDPERGRAARLAEDGVLERVGRGRGTHFILSRAFYRFVGEKGTYTRQKGLDRETNKALLLHHIRDNSAEGSPLKDLMQVLPHMTRYQIQNLLRELRQEGKVRLEGVTAKGLWYAGAKES